ncbi:hypothetical protein SEA_ROSMARINUS_78 [Mycobacterium Phage Rosmarinus]|uniref:Uncharacterized protein n=12 Tax=Anayavirus TaxID=2946797 RepID=A0A249XLU8_9CAUD|nr:hypothetical protein CL60_gp22 [Mycobacterium phage BarrelRoll]YP_009614101.1 hypothetical protein FDI60_gp23 [Mycobacterium phage Anaya]YP_009638070.1 hypothetical protein FGG34_gp23 [Mycobacterium phage JAWS]YP_009952317.1 hypothetical protein I5G89_gp23 [Mycobacterium phage Adephagia]YP_009952413.1 hypothetical protein I5G90_gp22 [Mycobacterium phage Adonis]YP_009952506.1 hypothetical protein I5G91_gp17 [Mycobacterium phage AlishaPH]YP_009952675.1 hypothetical protein I5G93_gp23 [Mycoba
MNRHLYTQPELFDADDARQFDVYERPDGSRYRVERPAAAVAL